MYEKNGVGQKAPQRGEVVLRSASAFASVLVTATASAFRKESEQYSSHTAFPPRSTRYYVACYNAVHQQQWICFCITVSNGFRLSTVGREDRPNRTGSMIAWVRTFPPKQIVSRHGRGCTVQLIAHFRKLLGYPRQDIYRDIGPREEQTVAPACDRERDRSSTLAHIKL